MKIIQTILMLVTLSTAAYSAPKVVVSISPLHSLVAGVMDGIGSPELLMSGANSEHAVNFSPKRISALAGADVVFIIGDKLEVKLSEISGTETVNGKKFFKFTEAVGLVVYPIREGGTWDSHEHEHEAESGAALDPHIWLDPVNAKVISRLIAEELVRVDPVNADKYNRNLLNQVTGLEQLDKDIKLTLGTVKDKPFIVFHDAYQYFEMRYGLNAVGSISDFSANAASAKRLGEIRTKIIDSKAECVFKEPQYSDQSIIVVTEGSSAKLGVLDPIGADIIVGKDAYGQLMRNLAQNLAKCLGS